MNLMKCLLQEKELRLSCEKYTLNDFQFVKRPASRPDQFVYANDASDIKAHPFFHDVPWSRLHIMKPPFVPKIRSLEDTRYFDEEEPVSDMEEASSSYSDNQEDQAAQPTIQKPTPRERAPELEWNANRVKIGRPDSRMKDQENQADNGKQSREHKRPRDKILRDPEVGKQVLEIRKRGAFLGYSWHRPPVMETEDTRGRTTRRSPRGEDTPFLQYQE